MTSSDKKTSARWIPLESNPEVLNSWSKQAGLIIKQDKFYDVFSLDPEMCMMIPQPVTAVILLFPITETTEKRKAEDDQKCISGESPAVDPTVIWIKQTISNACGTIGLLHALMNAPINVAPHSLLAKFTEACEGKTPEQRAELLETTPLFDRIHESAAHAGQTEVPQDLNTEFHFTCFVEAPSVIEGENKGQSGRRLIELDGRRVGPIDRGPSTELLQAAAEFIQEHYVSASSAIHFSVMALAAVPASE